MPFNQDQGGKKMMIYSHNKTATQGGTKITAIPKLADRRAAGIPRTQCLKLNF